MVENDFTSKIDKFIEQGDVPNLLLYGNVDHSKENIWNYFVNKIYPIPGDKQKYVLYINCVNTKGIKNIKDNIKLFSMQIINKRTNVQFKTIILDNGEHLTNDSQYSLRRTIEQFSHNTRFIMVCRNKHLLLNPILSRFVHLYIPDMSIKSSFASNPPFKIVNYQNPKLNKLLKDEYFTIPDDDPNALTILYDLALKLQHNNVFALELLHKFESHPKFNKVNTICRKHFHNFRSEVLSMFYILTLFRNNQDFEIYDLY